MSPSSRSRCSRSWTCSASSPGRAMKLRVFLVADGLILTGILAARVVGDPDEIPELPDEADLYVRPGDRWALGEHRLLCGDATDPAAVARLLDGAAPTLLATDP